MFFQKLPVLACLLCLPLLGHTQDRTWLLKWDATALLDPTTPAALYSIEIPVKDRWSLELGLGLPLYYLDRNKEEHEYREYRAELHWLMPARNRFQFIWGLEMFHIPRRYAYNSNYYLAEDGNEYFYDFARLTRNATGGCVKWGGRIPFGERFTFEFFAALGARLSAVHYYEVVNPSLVSSGPVFIGSNNLFSRDQEDGNQMLIHTAAGIKFGIALNTPKDETTATDQPKKKKKRSGRRKRH